MVSGGEMVGKWRRQMTGCWVNLGEQLGEGWRLEVVSDYWNRKRRIFWGFLRRKEKASGGDWLWNG